MEIGKFNIFSLSDGKFALDGGAMFGVVPKVLWNKLTPADELNRIDLGLHPLLIQAHNKNILIDTGIGDKFDEKFKNMYKIEKKENLIDSLNKLRIAPSDIDFVINTHLHFDHAGGNTIIKGNKVVPTFPNAKYIIQKKEWESAINPNERTKASYLLENFLPIKEMGLLELIDGDVEILPGIKTIITGGHTEGHQCVFIQGGAPPEDKKCLYLGDLVPTLAHIRITYIMGYDLYPLDTLNKKKELLNKAIEENWLLIFEHDPQITMTYIDKEYKIKDIKWKE